MKVLLIFLLIFTGSLTASQNCCLEQDGKSNSTIKLIRNKAVSVYT